MVYKSSVQELPLDGRKMYFDFPRLQITTNDDDISITIWSRGNLGFPWDVTAVGTDSILLGKAGGSDHCYEDPNEDILSFDVAVGVFNSFIVNDMTIEVESIRDGEYILQYVCDKNDIYLELKYKVNVLREEKCHAASFYKNHPRVKPIKKVDPS